MVLFNDHLHLREETTWVLIITRLSAPVCVKPEWPRSQPPYNHAMFLFLSIFPSQSLHHSKHRNRISMSITQIIHNIRLAKRASRTVWNRRCERNQVAVSPIHLLGIASNKLYNRPRCSEWFLCRYSWTESQWESVKLQRPDCIILW